MRLNVVRSALYRCSLRPRPVLDVPGLRPEGRAPEDLRVIEVIAQRMVVDGKARSASVTVLLGSAGGEATHEVRYAEPRRGIPARPMSEVPEPIRVLLSGEPAWSGAQPEGVKQ